MNVDVQKRSRLRRLVSPQSVLAVLIVFALMVTIIPGPGSNAAGPPIFPDLQTAPPSNLYFEQGYDGIWRLRFANTVSNHGGPLEITVDANKRIYQNVYDALWGGSVVDSRMVGSDLIFHPTHNHFHFADFARYDLLVQDSRGAFRRSPRQSQKTTFCIIDYRRVNAPGPSSPGYTTCGDDVQGLSAGWGDTYTADLPDQWIVLGSSRLANGNYAIRSTADPYNKLRESNEGNNEGIVYFSVVNGEIVSTGTPPICRVSTESAPVGAAVTLTCERIGANEIVDIRWGGPSTPPIQETTSSATGAVNAVVTIPEGTNGNHYLIATGRTSETEAAAIFNTVPSMTRQHWNRTVGSTTTITLRGFSSNEQVRVAFRVTPASSVVVGTATVDSKGSGSLLITIPVSTIGRHDLTATGLSTGLTANAAINVNPSVQVVPGTTTAGGQTGVSLRGYAGGEQVRIALNGTTIGQVRASSSGSTTASSALVTIPSTTAQGSHTLTATGLTSGGTSSATVQIVGVTLSEEPTSTPATPEPESTTPVDESTPTLEATIEPTATSEPQPNASPIANAGPDQNVEDEDGDGQVQIVLDGRASIDPEGLALSAVWTLPDNEDEDLEPQEIATGLNPTVSLSLGTYVVKLTVTDAAGNEQTDEVTITITAPAETDVSDDSTPVSD
jgi:hypothetical protein